MWNGRLRRSVWTPLTVQYQIPWREIYRNNVVQLADGGCLELAIAYGTGRAGYLTRQSLMSFSTISLLN